MVTPAGLLAAGCSLPMGRDRGAAPTLGFNLASWSDETNASPAPWRAAVDAIEALGVRRVTIVGYRFLDIENGTISEQSAHGLVAGPTLQVIAAVADHARGRGFDVGLVPFVEVDGPTDLGEIWRGTVTFDEERLPVFFSGYEAYVQAVAKIARDGGASRLYIGSELAALTKDVRARPYWHRLIAGLRRTVGANGSCTLSYAANFDEYEHVPFWGELDHIAVDAYFPLASLDEARGPGRPSEDVLMRGWDRVLRTLKDFAQRRQQRLTISEWGTVGFDLTTVRPWDWQPSQTPDVAEQSNAHRALLRSITSEGDWLSACDFWHWRIPGSEAGTGGFDAASEVISDIRGYATGS